MNKIEVKDKTLIVDGVEYVRKDSQAPAETLNGLEFKIVRGEKSGVFAGYIEKEEGRTVVIREARRLWYWDGAASLSELAESGTKKPSKCKFPTAVKKLKVLDAIEILDVTSKAKHSIDEVKIWEA